MQLSTVSRRRLASSRLVPLLMGVAGIVSVISCGGSSDGGGPATGGAATGGRTNTGGSSGATGGSTSSGGSSSTGGGSATGGNGTTGGTGTTGGASSTGGNQNTGGNASGGNATGGNKGTGGSTGGNAGGASATGGSGTTGGNAGGSSATGGTPGNTGGSSGTGSGACPAGATFCSGFEDSGLPTGVTYNPSYKAADWAQFVMFDTANKHSGKQSMLIKTGTDAYDPRLFTVKAPGKTFWVRMYMRTDIPLGKGQDHNSFFLATSSATGDVNTKGLEVGEQMCEIELNANDNRKSSVGGNPNGCAGQTGKQISANTWHCVEALFDGAGGNYQVFSDGEAIVDVKGWTASGLTADFAAFSFGSMHFNGDTTTAGRQIWYDDVAVAAQRIGCQ